MNSDGYLEIIRTAYEGARTQRDMNPEEPLPKWDELSGDMRSVLISVFFAGSKKCPVCKGKGHLPEPRKVERDRTKERYEMARVLLTGTDAGFLLHIAEKRPPDGVPVPYAKRWNSIARNLEQAGLVERHHVGKGHGACLTASGRQLLDSMSKL